MADESEPKYFATKEYKLWVRDRFLKKKWTYDQFAKEVTKRGFKTSGQALHKFLGNEGTDPVGTNTTLMPGINKVFGLPVPTHFDPTSPLSRLHHALDANWDRIPEATQKAWTLLITGSDPTEK
jgi:hypothetical protein